MASYNIKFLKTLNKRYISSMAVISSSTRFLCVSNNNSRGSPVRIIYASINDIASTFMSKMCCEAQMRYMKTQTHARTLVAQQQQQQQEQPNNHKSLIQLMSIVKSSIMPRDDGHNVPSRRSLSIYMSKELIAFLLYPMLARGRLHMRAFIKNALAHLA